MLCSSHTSVQTHIHTKSNRITDDKRALIIMNVTSTVLSDSILPPLCRLQLAELFCSACECALCEDCMSGHEEHPKVALSQALEQHRSSLQERLGIVQNR